MEIVYCASKSEPCTWFIFRENGVEVEIKLNGKELKSNKELTEDEIDFIKTNL